MISTKLSEARALKRIKQQDGHNLVIEWYEDEGHSHASYHVYGIWCSCGQGLRERSYSTRTGAVAAWDIKLFNQHINQVRNTETSMGEPILIGYVHKVRVSNEVWLFNEQNDVPDKHSKHYGITFYYPWNVLLKNNAGWQAIGGANTKEAATTKATHYLDKKSIYHEVEYVHKEKVGVEAPVATIVNSVTRLVDLANETANNPIKLADTLATIDEGLTQLKILIPLRNSVKERLEQSLDLNL